MDFNEWMNELHSESIRFMDSAVVWLRSRLQSVSCKTTPCRYQVLFLSRYYCQKIFLHKFYLYIYVFTAVIPLLFLVCPVVSELSVTWITGNWTLLELWYVRFNSPFIMPLIGFRVLYAIWVIKYIFGVAMHMHYDTFKWWLC